MRSTVAFAVLFLCGCAPKDWILAAPTEKNAVPIYLRAEYRERAGVDYRLERASSIDAGSRTEYWLNWHSDPNPKGGDLKIPVTAWIQFRQALRDARCDKWKEEKFDDTETHAFWRITVEYPDGTIRAAGSDAASMKKDFSVVRKALRDLTEGKVF